MYVPLFKNLVFYPLGIYNITMCFTHFTTSVLEPYLYYPHVESSLSRQLRDGSINHSRTTTCYCTTQVRCKVRLLYNHSLANALFNVKVQ